MQKDLTTGNIAIQLIKFTIPLVLGNVFQLMYNAIDSIIVGRFVGSHALSAVGICNPVSSLCIMFLNGLCLGASILMGNMFGAREYDRLHRQISTTMISGILFSLVLSVLCISAAHPILSLMQVDPVILPMAKLYFRIIFSGLIFTFMYNCFASTLRALGDSRSSLYFLIISSVVNIFGNLIFVLIFHMGSEGCAISTVLSELISCLLCISYIQKKVPLLRLGKKWLVFDRSLLKQTIAYGWVSAMQQATVQLGKLGVQSIANSMGVFVSAAFSAVNRIEDFAYIPEQNIAHAMTALMAQNKGAHKTNRITATFRCGMKIEFIYGIIVFFTGFLFAQPFMRLFSSDPLVCKHGVTYLKLISAVYIFPAITNGIQGYFRGIGDLKITLISSFVNMSVRVIIAAILVFHFSLQIEALPFAYLAGFIGMLITELPPLLKKLSMKNC